jgi:ribose 1,5-bisphosphokinase PhnN
VGTAEILVNPLEPPLDDTLLLDPNAPNIVVLLGPSGAGKSSVAKCLDSLGLADVNPTVATRPLRDTESATDTVDHVFATKAEFKIRDQRGDFLDTQPYYGFDYGVPYLRRPPDGQVALMVLKASFMKKFVAYYPNTHIYQIEVSPETAYQRMLLRGHESDDDIINRMKHYGPELDAGRLIAHRVFSNEGELNDTVRQVKDQILTDTPATAPLTRPAGRAG